MDGISLHCNSMAGAHKLDAEKTICHGRYLDAVLGLGSAELSLRVFVWEARWWRWQHTYSQSAMDEPPQALSPPPITSHVVRFSSPFSITKLCSSCSGFVFCFCFLEGMCSCLILWIFCVFVSQENFWVYGLLESGLVTMFMGLFLGFIYDLVSWIYFLFFWI